MIIAITPDEVCQASMEAFPEPVIKAWNTLITKNWNNGSSCILQNEAVKAILAEYADRGTSLTRQEVFDRNYLDIEPLYRAQGWYVKFDKPGYNESYEANFEFRRGKSVTRVEPVY